MHVLFVDPFVHIGGPHQVTERLVQRLTSRGWSVTVGVPAPGPGPDRLRLTGARVITVPGIIAFQRGFSKKELLAGSLKAVRAVFVLRNYAKKENVRIIHSVTAACPVGGLAARLSRVPSVYHVHDLTLNANKIIGAAIGCLLWITADRILCVSRAALEALPFLKRNREKARVVYNAVDPGQFSGLEVSHSAVRQSLGLPPETPLVGAFGGLDERKGQDVYIKAAALVVDQVPEARFVLVGGPSPASLRDGFYERAQRLVRELNLAQKVFFLGPRDDVPALLQEMDLVVQPSRVDAGPILPLEAMASGVAVIATNVGGNPEEVEDGVTGIIVPPKDEAAMANAVVDLLRDPGRRKELGKAGRMRVMEQFNLNQQAEQVSRLYEELIGTGLSPG